MVEKQVVIICVIFVVLAAGLSGCADEKSKFIGTWNASGGGGSMTFTNDNKVTATVTLGDISLSGTYTWAVSGGKITFTSESGGSIGYTFNYRFPTDNQLIFTNSNGGSFTFTKA